jgi:uncharacterized protein involved in exopolysaccharide biosynthesis
VTLKVTWTDPKLAAEWANGLVALANEVIRQSRLDESARNISYLEQKLKTIDHVEIRQGIFSLLQSEIGQAMLVEGSQDYAFKVVDPAVEAERPVSPVLPIWMVVGGVLCAGLVGFWLLMKEARTSVVPASGVSPKK